MDNLPQVELTNHPLTSWANKVNSHSRSNQLSKSSDFQIKRGPYGTSIKLNSEFKLGNDYCRYRSEYDPSKGYAIYDIVRVLPNKDYADANGDVVKATPGVWICVVNVPSLYFTNVFAGSKDAFKRYVRQDGIDYKPRIDSDGNEPSTLATLNSPDGRYWEQFGSLPTKLVVCKDGEGKEYFIDASPVPDDSED
jgi:hypothetical protein